MENKRADAGRDGRTCLVRPNSQAQTGNATRLVPNLLNMTTNTQTVDAKDILSSLPGGRSRADRCPSKIQRGHGHPRRVGVPEGTADADGTGAGCVLRSPCGVCCTRMTPA